jgi:saxitoxin biosynthesis operon SxtJ-like protein
MTKGRASAKELRRFGLIVGGVFSVIGLWPLLIRQEPPRVWALAAAAVLILPAVVYPPLLDYPHRGWMRLGHALGWINTRVILAVFFYAILTPVGVIMRLAGRDAVGRKFEPGATSYRQERQPRSASHMWHQF